MTRTGKWWLTTALAVGLAACAPPADEQDGAEPPEPRMTAAEATQDMIDRFDAAIGSGDSDAMVALYTADGNASPPGGPTVSGADALRGFFTDLFAEGGINVKNALGSYLEDGDLIASYGTYTITADGAVTERGSWSSLGRRTADGGYGILHNIWNRDEPAPGEPPPPPIAESGPAPAADAACHATPTEVDQAFEATLEAGNVSALVAMHAEDGLRLPPGMPAMKGHAEVSRYLASRVEPYKTRVLDLTDIREGTSGNLGWTAGQFSFNYTPKKKGPAATGAGSYQTIQHRGEDGCWRYKWVIWNSDTPPAPAT